MVLKKEGFTVNEIILSKKARLERCIKQIKTYYALPSDIPFESNYLIQDAILLNLQRSCELCIDIANIAVKENKLGLPCSSKESFILLKEAGIIDQDLCKKLSNMVGFRNILVHSYEKMNLELMEKIISTNKLQDLVEFANIIIKLSDK